MAGDETNLQTLMYQTLLDVAQSTGRIEEQVSTLTAQTEVNCTEIKELKGAAAELKIAFAALQDKKANRLSWATVTTSSGAVALITIVLKILGVL